MWNLRSREVAGSTAGLLWLNDVSQRGLNVEMKTKPDFESQAPFFRVSLETSPHDPQIAIGHRLGREQ